MICGIENCIGDFVFLLDVDLEESPELFEEFYTTITTNNYDLVYGVQLTRNKDKYLGKLFWKVLKLFSDIKVEHNVCTIRIMSRRFVEALKLLPQKDFYLGELSQFVGFNQGTIAITKTYKGHSTYSFSKKLNMFVDMFYTNASRLWFRISMIAIVISIISFLFFTFLLITYFSGKTYLKGWLSIMVSISLFASINFFFLSVILQYVSKVTKEVKNNPRYIIAERYGDEINRII